MEDLMQSKEEFFDYIPKNKKEYQNMIQCVLYHADFVCFTVLPFLDNIGEFNNSIWSRMRYSVADYGFARAASDSRNDKSHLILFKKDYFVYQFLKEKSNIFDFQEEDSVSGIMLEDPAFIRKGEVFCYTITHEKMCIMTEDIYRQITAAKQGKRKKTSRKAD